MTKAERKKWEREQLRRKHRKEVREKDRQRQHPKRKPIDEYDYR